MSGKRARLRLLSLLAIVCTNICVASTGRHPSEGEEPDSAERPSRIAASYVGALTFAYLGNAIVDGVGHSAFALRTIHGVRVGDHFSIALGFGREHFVTADFYPLFVDLRGYFAAKKTGGFVCVEIGQTLSTDSPGTISDGGMLLHGGGGIEIPLGSGIGFVMELAYERQTTVEKHSFSIFNGYGTSTQMWKNDISYDLVSASVGLSW